GDRRGTRTGPEVRSAHVPDGTEAMFEIAGNDVRITGVRMRGPTRSLDEGPQVDKGIFAHSRFTSIIDHNELSDWPVAAIEVTGDNIRDNRPENSVDNRPEHVRIARNFIHHNRRGGTGYGVVTSSSGYASIEGNTFVENRHAIAGDGTKSSGYRAWFNLALHDGPDYGHGIQQDFDMHGVGSKGIGGIAGQYIEIARNTFLGADRENFYLRGTPTYLAEFHHNVSVGLRSFVIKNEGAPDKLIIGDNQFVSPNPTN